MTINKTESGSILTLTVSGRLDTATSPELEAELEASLNGKDTLIFDLAQLEYISSAGLRVLLTAQKVMNRQGQMTVKNVNETVFEVFEITGFSDIMNIEQR